MEEYTFKKSTCERYDLRWKHNGWATFTIDENGGIFSVQSDFGNYNYAWPKNGRESFKHFLIEITRSPDYVLGKISKEDYFDPDKAEKKWKAKIIELRKDRECTKEQARDAWEFLVNDLNVDGSVDYLQSEIYGNSAIAALSEEPWYEFEIDLDYPRMAVRFVNEVMPMFADILRKEIEDADAKKPSAPTESPKEISQVNCTIDSSKIAPLVDKVWAEEVLRKEG